jgi:hypothetical protein
LKRKIKLQKIKIKYQKHSGLNSRLHAAKEKIIELECTGIEMERQKKKYGKNEQIQYPVRHLQESNYVSLQFQNVVRGRE